MFQNFHKYIYFLFLRITALFVLDFPLSFPLILITSITFSLSNHSFFVYSLYESGHKHEKRVLIEHFVLVQPVKSFRFKMDTWASIAMATLVLHVFLSPHYFCSRWIQNPSIFLSSDFSHFPIIFHFTWLDMS